VESIENGEHMTDTAGHLGDAANLAAKHRQDDIAHDIFDQLTMRGENNRATGGSGRIEASLNLEPYSDIDPVYVEAGVAQLAARVYRPREYAITVKHFDTRGSWGGLDYDSGVFRIFMWVTPITD
jgi:hypothetical protein